MPTLEDKPHEPIGLMYKRSGAQNTKPTDLNALPDITLETFPIATRYGFADHLRWLYPLCLAISTTIETWLLAGEGAGDGPRQYRRPTGLDVRARDG